MRIIVGFVNINIISDFLIQMINKNENNPNKLFILCAGTDGHLSYEDSICAGAIIDKLESNNIIFDKTDSARVAQDLFNIHSAEMVEFLKTTDHAKFLAKLNLSDDINIALSQDIYPVIPFIAGGAIKNYITK
jgi:2-phosphosulfolactate phosphatase